MKEEEELNFEEIVMGMSIQPTEISKDLTPQEFESKLAKNMDVGFIKGVADGIEVDNEESARSALSMSLQARKMKNQLDESRKEIVKPHFDYQKAINKIVKDLEDKFEEIEDILKIKINDWNEVRKELPFENMIDLEIKVEDGVLYTQKKWDYIIEDASLVPREYLIVNEKKIKEAIAGGVRNIPGVKIYEKEELIMRIKNN